MNNIQVRLFYSFSENISVAHRSAGRQVKTAGKTAIAQFNLFTEMAYEGSIEAAQEKKFLEDQRHLATLERYGEAMDGSQSSCLGGQGIDITRAVHLDPSRPGKYQRVVVPAGGTVLRAMNIKGEAMEQIVPFKFGKQGNSFNLEPQAYFRYILSCIPENARGEYLKTAAQLTEGEVPRTLHISVAADVFGVLRITTFTSD